MKYIFIGLLFFVSINGESLKLAHNQMPSGFGKTHFILGSPTTTSSYNTKSTPHNSSVCKANTTSCSVFFAPDADVRKELIQLIDAEKKGIAIAIFLLTDSEIADALSRAKKRNVPIELVTDASCLRERYNKIGRLCEAGCAVYVYNPAYNKKDTASIMHHKFALFKENTHNQPAVWTGSFNFTKAGSAVNQENAIVLHDQKVVDQFETQFKKLKERAYRYGKNKV